MGEVHGECDSRFAPVRALLEANQDNGRDEGMSLCITLGGETVVDVWAGHRDLERTVPFDPDTLVVVFSTSKAMVILVTLMLYDRGLLDLDAPIAEHWPEFARHGKQAITTRQVLTHSSGFPGFGRTIGFDEMHDWDLVVSVLEDAEPWFEPGTVTCYSPISFGFVLGELVHRVDGRPFVEVFRDELARPLGADFHFGVTDPVEQARVSCLWYPDFVLPPDLDNEIAVRLLSEDEGGRIEVPPRLAAVMPAANGAGSARGIARIATMVAMGGELDGRRYLSRATLEEASREQNVADDLALGPIRYGLGFGLYSEFFPWGGPTAFHWGGYGGSFIWMDMETGCAAGFAPNRLELGDNTPHGDRVAAVMSQISEVVSGLS